MVLVSGGRVASGIASQIASRAYAARKRVHVASLRASRVASAVARRLAELQAKAVDPHEALASGIVRRLASAGVYASARGLRSFRRRVASGVARELSGAKSQMPVTDVDVAGR